MENVENFCPLIHGLCRSGFPGCSDLPCVMFDVLSNRCAFAQTQLVTLQRLMQSEQPEPGVDEPGVDEPIRPPYFRPPYDG